jgi:hypothetical protein
MEDLIVQRRFSSGRSAPAVRPAPLYRFPPAPLFGSRRLLALASEKEAMPGMRGAINLWVAGVAALCCSVPLQAQEPSDPARRSVHVLPAVSAGGLWWTERGVIALSPAVQVELSRGARAVAATLEWWVLESDCTTSVPAVCAGPESGVSIEATHRWWISGTRGMHPFAAASAAAYFWKVDACSTGGVGVPPPLPGCSDPFSGSGGENTEFRPGAGVSLGVDLGNHTGYALRVSGTYRLLTSGGKLAHGTLALRIPVSRGP